ncbi:hypothetical protein ACN27B_29355 [Micromonospora sp. WMMD754]|uniref:hypothetical protein n=1 Tax=Micromonospora sp. WMMD754 TaxID=3404114 RepID=UPI003BF55BDA
MSTQRLRVLHGEGRLPDPDVVDADGQNVWFTVTIDRWLRATGRPVPEDAVWPFGWADATQPAEVIWAGNVVLPRGCAAAITIFDCVGHSIVYAVGYAGQDVGRDAIAEAAVARLAPDRRPGAVVVQPYLLDPGADGPRLHLELWRTPEHAEPSPEPLPGFLHPAHPPAAVPGLAAPRRRPTGALQHGGSVLAAEVARVLGRPLPLWWAGTTTPETVRTVRLLDRPSPLRIRDTITEWPGTVARLSAVVDRSVHALYPQAFALLARESRAVHRDVTAALTGPTTGDGWFLAAAPEPPVWPAALEQQAAVAAARGFDPDIAATELDRLAEIEAVLPWGPDDAYGAALHEAILLLRGQLAAGHPERVYTFPVTYSWPDAHGPICDEYRRHLTRLTAADPHGDPVHPTRRLVRLLTEDATDAVIARHHLLDRARERLIDLCQDPDGRLVARLASGTSHLADTLLIEWPTGMPPAGWTAQTVIAADRTHCATGLFALTPGPDGALLPPQPVPNPGGEPGFTFGYDGASPAVLYRALVRCALGEWDAAAGDQGLRSAAGPGQGRHSGSQLWQQIVTSQGALRMPWADVQRWAHADQRTSTAGAPTASERGGLRQSDAQRNVKATEIAGIPVPAEARG